MKVKQIKLLVEQEIEWHKEFFNQDKTLSDDYKTGFIKGLNQVLILLKENSNARL